MREEQMHMILDPADDERLAFEIREDAADVAMEFVAHEPAQTASMTVLSVI